MLSINPSPCSSGKAFNSPKLQGEGLADQAKGTTQKTYGDAKEDVKDAVKGR